MAKKTITKYTDKKGGKPISSANAVKTQFQHGNASGNAGSARKNMSNAPHRASKAEKGSRKK